MERGYQYGHLVVILSTTGNRDSGIHPSEKGKTEMASAGRPPA